ncbi:substrate-binding domain-containing protein [Shewanella mesophila]|uniref:substrate-binding domain-containing protein n=1 Tax=Shewanella mesophila TaxID=2864208 RepID=UPI001C65C15D|nr:substrate-binding domain-containing protein [Shewanella mesophila]QYJ86935.1 substrate-binding domain-containing protein [Shewanella mesophila]
MARLLITLIVFSLLPILPVSGKELRFAVVPKYYSVFFDQSEIGCKNTAAQIDGVECIYRGPDVANVRVQNQLINQLIDEGIDGIAVAITQSKFLAENSIRRAKEAGIPVITYDSDFDDSIKEKPEDLRLAYIGTDNFELGKALGEQLKKLRPNGGTLIMQTGRPDSPNLNLRLMGVRSALSGKVYPAPPGELLNNDRGWTEVREPFLNFDQLGQAVKQMESVMKGKPVKADSFIAVGGWAQNNEALYREMIVPYQSKIDNNEVVIIISDASPSQLSMLQDRLAHINIGQNPYEMGRQAILTLHKIVTKQDYDEIIYTPIRFCTPDNYDSCVKIATPEPASD